MRRSERLIFALLAAASLLLRAVAFFHYRFDSDEPQHLHVAWSWTAGLVQYRDTFDNHAPLFHILTAPLLAAFGERADILLWMRAPMLLLWASVLACTWILARRLHDDARVAAWSVLLLSVFPPFFLKSLEYRPDNLWNALWMLLLVVVVARPPTFVRSLIAGLLLGCAFAVSLKTVLLGTALVAAAIALGQWKRAMPTLLGFLVVPGAVVLWFHSAGALDALIACNFGFNGSFAEARTGVWIRRALYPIALGALAWIARRTRASSQRDRHALAIACGAYIATALCIWPLLSPRDFLPLMPIAAIFLAAPLVHRRAWATIVAVGCLASLWHYADRFQNETDEHITMMNQTLRLTRPGETILDYKGETIYRRRPFYYALETVTRAKLADGSIRDTMAADVIRTGTHVAQADGAMWPPRSREFLNANFLQVGRLRASGQMLQPDGTFTIAVPGEYVILDDRGEAAGKLDGRQYIGARTLAAGAHRFESIGPERPLAVLWAPAFRRGHTPFVMRDRDF